MCVEVSSLFHKDSRYHGLSSSFPEDFSYYMGLIIHHKTVFMKKNFVHFFIHSPKLLKNASVYPVIQGHLKNLDSNEEDRPICVLSCNRCSRRGIIGMFWKLRGRYSFIKDVSFELAFKEQLGIF